MSKRDSLYDSHHDSLHDSHHQIENLRKNILREPDFPLRDFRIANFKKLQNLSFLRFDIKGHFLVHVAALLQTY